MTLDISDIASPGAAESAVGTAIKRRYLPRAATFVLLVSMLLVFLAASSAPTPMYGVYASQWGFGSLTVTAVFGSYAIAVLVSLLSFGSLSDHIGRRPVLLGAVAMQIVAITVFLTASGVTSLFLARTLQGLSTGAALGALGAGLLDLDRIKGTTANAVGAMAGTALGALISGIFVALLPAPTHLIYAVILVVLAIQGVGVAFMRESASPLPGALASLRPQLSVPPTARGPLALAIPTFVSVWALAGLYGSLGPALTRQLTGSSSAILGGLALFTMAGAGSLTVLITRNTDAVRLMTFGGLMLLTGVGITQFALVSSSVAVLFVGTTIAGVGFGGAFQGALRTVIPLAQVHERAGLLSAVFVACYLAMGVPAVIAGALISSGSLITIAREYGFAVMALATIPLIGVAVRSVRSRTSVA